MMTKEWWVKQQAASKKWVEGPRSWWGDRQVRWKRGDEESGAATPTSSDGSRNRGHGNGKVRVKWATQGKDDDTAFLKSSKSYVTVGENVPGDAGGVQKGGRSKGFDA